MSHLVCPEHGEACGVRAEPGMVCHPPAKDWRLTSIHDRGPAHFYRYQVEGLNLNYTPDRADYRFSWSIPDLDDPRFDVEGAERTYAPGVEPSR